MDCLWRIPLCPATTENEEGDRMDKTTSGWINGFIGVLIFSGSLPATRAAVADFNPLFLTVARAAIAGVLALGLLLAFRENGLSGGILRR
jgi:drug/metabolite transporter (DMT)-like permease